MSVSRNVPRERAGVDEMALNARGRLRRCDEVAARNHRGARSRRVLAESHAQADAWQRFIGACAVIPINREPLRVSEIATECGVEVGFAVNPVLARDAVPALVLGPPGSPGRPGADGGARLGWNTWLPNSAAMPRRSDATEANFEAEIVEGQT